MGGVINVAIRLRDGQTFCQERWTNNIPYWFSHPDMFTGDDRAKQYLALVHHNDFILDPDFMGKPTRLRCSEYGIIIWDYVTNTILDNNGYSNPTTVDAALAAKDVSRGNDYDEKFTFLADSNRLRLRKQIWSDRKLIAEEISDMLSGEQARVKALAAWNREYGSARVYTDRNFVESLDFVIDTNPMTYYTFEEQSRGLPKDMRAKLIEIGFPMTKPQGLNTTVKPTPKAYPLTRQEKVARQNFMQLKKTPEGQQFDGVRFEDAPRDFRDQMMSDAAHTILNARVS